MPPKPSTSVSTTVDSHCQHISPKGNRCHMLIDQNHRLANGPQRPTLCAYHAERLRAAAPIADPEVLAADLLTDIDSFTTADEVNLFLGNLVRQLARKRIARRDAIALAYISQLILTSQTAMARQRAADEPDAATEAEFVHLIAGLRQRSSELASHCTPQSTGGRSGTRHECPPARRVAPALAVVAAPVRGPRGAFFGVRRPCRRFGLPARPPFASRHRSVRIALNSHDDAENAVSENLGRPRGARRSRPTLHHLY